MEENDPTVPTNAADATEEVNQQQVEDQNRVEGHRVHSEEPESGVTPSQEVDQNDERVPEQETNDVVTSDQTVTEPALRQPDQPDEPDSENWRKTRQDIADQGETSQE